MDHKILLTIDLSKIDKNKVVPRTYTNKDGVTITSKDYKIEIIPLKEEKLIKEGDGWKMMKVCWAIEALTKEERAQNVKGKSLGDGIAFKNTKPKTDENQDEW